MTTIKDIADQVGVSMMTVSRAFNEPKKVKEEVRQEIYAIAKQLKYLPNQAAKSLASKRTGVIQIVANMSPEDSYFTLLFTGAAHYLSSHGYSIMISKDQARKFQYDGAIYMGLACGQDKKLLEKNLKPFVLFGKSDLDIDWVDVDNVEGSYKITKYLIDQGHRNIGFVKINQDEPFTEERYQGYVKAMKEKGLAINQERIYQVNHSIEAVRHICPKAFKDKEVTAYVCESDVLAYAMIDYAKEEDIAIPEEVSIVGFDGFLFNQMSVPHITTVRQPVYHIGMTLGKTLLDRINQPQKEYERILIPTIFEKGGSVKALNI